MKTEDQAVLETISSTAWRSATDIAVASGNQLGRELPTARVSRLLKQLETQGVVEKMKNRNRLFYRKVE